MRHSVLHWQLNKGGDECGRLGEWPLLHNDGRRLMLVMQHWVCEPAGNGWLGPGLEQDEQCQTLVVELKAARLFAELKHLAGVSEEAARLCVELQELAGMSRGVNSGSDRLDVLRDVWLEHAALGDDYSLGRLLHERRLPETPSARAYVWPLVAEEPLPATLRRQARVICLVFGEDVSDLGCPIRWEWDKKSGRPSVVVADPTRTPEWLLGARDLRFHDGSPTWAIEVELPTADLLRAASSKVLAQQKWLNKWRSSRFSYERLKDCVAPARAKPEILGYGEEALHDKHTQRLKEQVQKCPGKADAIISRHLSEMQRKVYKRRKGRGLETAIDVVEPGYREIGKAVLRKRLLGD
jgi:hypothetical protein